MSKEIIGIGSESRPPLLVMGEYQQWKRRMIHFLDLLDENLMKSICEGPIRPTVIVAAVPRMETCPALPAYIMEKPVDMYTPEQIARHLVDKRALTLLIMALPNDMYPRVDSLTNARDVWLEIEQQMQGGDTTLESQKESALNAYEGFRAIENESLTDSYQRLNSFYEVNVKFLKNLTQEWQNMATNIHLSRILELWDNMRNLSLRAIDPLALATMPFGGPNSAPIQPTSFNHMPLPQHPEDFNHEFNQNFNQGMQHPDDPMIITISDEELFNMNESLALISHNVQRLNANRGFTRSQGLGFQGGNRMGQGRGGHQSSGRYQFNEQGRGGYQHGERYQSFDQGRNNQGRFRGNHQRDSTYIDYQGGQLAQTESRLQLSGKIPDSKDMIQDSTGKVMKAAMEVELKVEETIIVGQIIKGTAPIGNPLMKIIRWSKAKSATKIQQPNLAPQQAPLPKSDGHGPTCYKYGKPGHYSKECTVKYKDATYFEKKAALMRKKEKGVALLVEEENWVCEEESSNEDDQLVRGHCLMADFKGPDGVGPSTHYDNDGFEERTKLFTKIQELEDNNFKRGQSEQTLSILTMHANKNPFYKARAGLGLAENHVLEKAASNLYNFKDRLRPNLSQHYKKNAI
ncbi:hypothetical protein OSB04_006784 [Centaurea solstitialis]|uniref:CCHC-type domain-containing protein n=1 Tax=Centaurea solstitialis TaxID=347529 RepID=A0AA38TKD0_9ASTR|nr:hypothetical protein OSB04_006784 [Centaurea solstitialis]